MENRCIEVFPHPQLIDMLFAYKIKISAIFKDVLGLYEIDHMAVTRIDHQQQILVCSSTPAMEFNLFTSKLWTFDNTYNPAWFNLCTQASWESLYNQERFDELYYTKQIKHHFPTGLSMAVSEEDNHYIYSIASTRCAQEGLEHFLKHKEDFYKIGQYCKKLLNPVFLNMEASRIHLSKKHRKINFREEGK